MEGGGVGVFSVVIENLAAFLYSAFLRDRFAREAKRLFGLYKGSEGGGGEATAHWRRTPKRLSFPRIHFWS